MSQLANPTFKELFTGYEVLWEEQVRLKAESCKIHSDGTFKAQVAIDAKLNGGWQKVLTPAIINFSSGAARTKLSKDLKERVPDIDWYSVVELASEELAKRFKQGDPAIELWADVGEVKPPQYLIEPYIIKNYPNVIFGDPGSFKSAFAMALAMIGCLDWRDNPLQIRLSGKEPLRILWLDWETDEDTARWTMTRFKRGMVKDTFPIQYMKMTLSLNQELDRIKYQMDETKANILVIDSLGLAAGASGGNLNDAEPAIRFYSALRQLKTTSLIIAHNSKSQDVKTRSILGSMFYTAQARNIWESKKVAEPGDESTDIALFHRKAPPFDKLRKAHGYRVDFETDKIMMKHQDATTVREFVEGMGTQARITNALGGGPHSEPELAQMLEASSNNIRVACYRLKAKGKIIKLPDGKWGLLESNYTEGEG